MNKDFFHTIESIVQKVRNSGLYPDVGIVRSAATEPMINVDGKKYLSFGTNNYLGMSYHPEILKAMHDAVNKYGMGSGGPRLLSGNLDIHNKLEATIASYLGYEATMCFTTGYMANIGIIPAVSNLLDLSLFGLIKNSIFGKRKEASIISDEYNHGSIIDGARLAYAERLVYKHRDIDDLEDKLKQAKNKHKIIITDGIFSMDGDIAPLPQIVELSKKYQAILVVDDAHAIGVIGEHGKGTVSYFNLEDDVVDVTIGTFTKAFGGIGGFVVGSRILNDYLRITARTYMLSAPLPPAVAAGLIKSVELVERADNKRKKAKENADYFRNSIQSVGFNTITSEVLICPVLIGDEQKVIKYTNELMKRGIYAPNVRYPAVPRGRSRIRFVLTASHTKDQIDYLVKQMKEIKKVLS